MELIGFLLLLCIFLIVLIFLMRNFKWIVIELRNICENESGYIKLMQLVFVLLVLSSFFGLLIYNLIYRETTSKLDVFLTVIVGLMGTIMGTFFSERTMESIKKDRDKKRKAIIEKTARIKEKLELLSKLIKRLD
mgnify:CR=1 FL=1